MCMIKFEGHHRSDAQQVRCRTSASETGTTPHMGYTYSAVVLHRIRRCACSIPYQGDACSLVSPNSGRDFTQTSSQSSTAASLNAILSCKATSLGDSDDRLPDYRSTRPFYTGREGSEGSPVAQVRGTDLRRSFSKGYGGNIPELIGLGRKES
ncbi:hypothetical protein BGY98DRAFT_941332, partial [Russula aff. rugulosa BPL654]